jgi:hypothetical protein
MNQKYRGAKERVSVVTGEKKSESEKCDTGLRASPTKTRHFPAPLPLRLPPHIHLQVVTTSAAAEVCAAMAMAMLGAPTSFSSQLCTISGRTPAQPQLHHLPGAFSLKRSGSRGVCVRAQQGRGSGG